MYVRLGQVLVVVVVVVLALVLVLALPPALEIHLQSLQSRLPRQSRQSRRPVSGLMVSQFDETCIDPETPDLPGASGTVSITSGTASLGLRR